MQQVMTFSSKWYFHVDHPSIRISQNIPPHCVISYSHNKTTQSLQWLYTFRCLCCCSFIIQVITWLPPRNGKSYVFISVGLCVSLLVCLFVSVDNIAEKQVNRFSWHFQDRSGMTQGTIWKIWGVSHLTAWVLGFFYQTRRGGGLRSC